MNYLHLVQMKDILPCVNSENGVRKIKKYLLDIVLPGL